MIGPRLIKTGALTKAHEKQLVSLSAWAECIGYIGSITLSFIKLKELTAKERAIRASMEKKRKVRWSRGAGHGENEERRPEGWLPHEQ